MTRSGKTKTRSGCGSRKGSICSPPESQPLTTYAAIVRAYQKYNQADAEEFLKYYAELPSYSEALKQSALARSPHGKRNRHLRRIPESSLKRSYKRLQKCNLEACQSFDELLEIVNREIRGIYKIGELTVYDTAQLIGAYLGLQPEVVYLHAGTKKGAAALGIRRRESIEPSELPPPFHKLTPAGIEDCLCIYKKALKAIQAAKR